MEPLPTRAGPPEVLIVIGAEDARREIHDALAAGNFTCREAESGSRCLREVERSLPDLVILDLYLPDQSGIGLCRLLREDAKTARMPIIVVSSQASEIDRVVAFESGVDDFVPRPFYAAELRARVDAVLRGFCSEQSHERAVYPAGVASERLEASQLTIDARAGLASVDGHRVDLTAKEFALLVELASHAGRVVRRRQLIERLWGDEAAPTARAIDAHIKSIRRKLGGARSCIETVRGVGYRFADESPTATAARAAGLVRS